MNKKVILTAVIASLIQQGCATKKNLNHQDLLHNNQNQLSTPINNETGEVKNNIQYIIEDTNNTIERFKKLDDLSLAIELKNLKEKIPDNILEIYIIEALERLGYEGNNIEEYFNDFTEKIELYSMMINMPKNFE